MQKSELVSLLREYVKNNLSPTKEEQDLVTNLYAAFKATLGSGCLLIGSFARFTASRPLHDLDILFVDGEFDPNNLHPQTILTDLKNNIQNNFQNPTKYQTKISQQTHSITVSFVENGQEKFAVDIVPAYTSGSKNEYGDDVYWVPEILKTGKRSRQARYEEFSRTKKSELEWWLKSDPRGYIKAATDLNSKNNDFRKTTKFVKRWKHNCKVEDEDFKLKSFHIEQAIFAIYKQNPNFDITDTIFKFFCDIPEIIAHPKIKDRADQAKFIDEYVGSLTNEQKEKIIQARDHFLIKLENLSERPSVADLLKSGFHNRVSDAEEYLFDSQIPVFLEDESAFRIQGEVLPRDGGFRGRVLDAIGLIEVDRKIQFRIVGNSPQVDLFKWKVKNDNKSEQPRGEITDHRTLRDPEHSLYRGNHFVECYAVRNGICVARAKQNVVL